VIFTSLTAFELFVTASKSSIPTRRHVRDRRVGVRPTLAC
jgi:hypothetical protein